MKKIVCLGTSHTYGGAEEKDYTFDEGWPGQLSSYLQTNNVDNYIFNGGESSAPFALASAAACASGQNKTLPSSSSKEEPFIGFGYFKKFEDANR